MSSIDTTPASVARGRQIGELLADRYRLAMSKGGDDMADVWHALDESTQKVVTLEILRDPSGDDARQRFLAEARRMAAIERPSVMRVSAIHDEGAHTFIVFEHLIPLPVVLTGLTAIARDMKPATKAAEDDKDKTVVLTPVAPQAPAPVAPSTLAALAGPKRAAAATEEEADAATPPTIVELDVPEPPLAISRSLASAGSDVTRVMTEATRLATKARLRLREVRPESLLVAARAFISRVDTSQLTALAARAASRARQLAGAASSVRVPLAHAAETPKVEAAGAGAAVPNIGSLGKGLASAALPFIARARGNRLVLGGAALAVVAVALVASPLDDAITSALRSRPAPSPTAAPTPALVPAPFDVPPLAAYGAAFESQGAYPTTSPNGSVEWVVALRNTGSAGWYRGIEGAQAALALPDGAGVAVQSTAYVAPGQVGWFVAHFRARAEPGTYKVQLLPRIDGRGPLQDLGIFAVVTVSKNP